MASAELSKESQAVLAAGELDLSLALDEIRALADRHDPKVRGNFVYPGTSEERNVPSVDNGIHYEVPVTVLQPEGDGWKNVMVYFHGGGFVRGSRKSHMAICELISHQCSCVVINVEYRLSPEHKFPACYTDAEAVVRWALDNKQELANNSSAIVGVAGDSAGGNIAATVCHLVEGLSYQVLAYPVLTIAGQKKYPSFERFRNGFMLTEELMDWFTAHFLRSKEDGEDPLCCPMDRTSFDGLPPALFIVAECDILADQSAAYQTKLKASGVKTDYILLQGTLHGCINKPGSYKDTIKPAIDGLVAFLESF